MQASRVPAHSALTVRISAAVAIVAGIGIFAETAGLVAQQAPANAAACAVTGTITGLGGPLPGVAITVRRGDTVQTATSTNTDGTFKVALPDNTYQLTADLTGFDHVQKDVTVNKADACMQTVDLAMTLTPRTASTAAPAGARAAGPGGRAAGAGRGAGAGAAAGGGFQALTVQENAIAANIDFNALEANQPQSDLTPAGFGSEAVAEAFAVSGDAARVDRSALNDRRDSFQRGDFQLPNQDGRGNDGGFGGGNTPSLASLNGGQGGFNNNNGGFGNNNNGGGRGGRGNNNGNFQLGGRGGRQQRLQYQFQYGYAGSALDSPKKQLRSDVPIAEAPYGKHNYSFQIQTPFKIPGILKNENNSTLLRLQLSGNAGTNLFDQTATVPVDAVRNGDFSGVTNSFGDPVIIKDPLTGLPFPGNIIPADRMSQQALGLLKYYPAPNLPGTTKNYHFSSSTNSKSNNVQVGLQHNFSGQAAGGGGGGRGGGGGGNNNQRQSNVGLAGKGKQLLGTRTNVNMNLNVTYQQSDSDQLNIFQQLGGHNTSHNYSVQDTFNIQHGRAQQQIGIQYNHSHSQTLNHFTNSVDISGPQGLDIGGASTDPFAYGLPKLTFATISGLSDVTPNLSAADRASLSYNFRHPWRRTHQLQMGGDFRYDVTSTHTEGNANGTFAYTGYATGLDFADFLLGNPQSASLSQGPGDVTLTSKTMGLFFQDEWKVKPSLTAQLGVRYDMLWPFTERDNHMVNLDVTPDFTAAAPVEAGADGAFTGAFPKGMIHSDTNNVSPKLGIAWRGPKRFIIRSSYEVNYNNNTYSAIARQLTQQPPFARTGTNFASTNSLLLMSDALNGIDYGEVTNTYGIDKNYVFGTVQQGVVNVQRQLGETWQTQAQYTHTRGANLDIIQAPNRDPGGQLRIEDVQPFTWTSSQGRQELNAGNFRIDKRASRGIQWSVQYTLAKSRDNSPSIGGGGVSSRNIAQNDQDLNAEWGLSNFDVRHQVTISAQMELPFGPNRRWLVNPGFFQSILADWRFSPSFTAQTGSPQSITVRNSVADVNQGVTGALRANYDGAQTALTNPSINEFFNTDAFSAPPIGSYGDSPRNVVIGPGSKNLNMNFNRAVRLSDNHNMNIQVNITDLLNMTNYTGIDTNVNSITFGQVTGVSGNRTIRFTMQFRY
jgi:hypothetical protein